MESKPTIDNYEQTFLNHIAQIISQNSSLEQIWLEFMKLKIFEFASANKTSFSAAEETTFSTNLDQSIKDVKIKKISPPHEEDNNNQISLYDLLSMDVIKKNPKLCHSIFEFIITDNMKFDEDFADFLVSFLNDIGFDQFLATLQYFDIINFYEIEYQNKSLYQKLITILASQTTLEILKQTYAADPEQVEQIDENTIKNILGSVSHSSSNITALQAAREKWMTQPTAMDLSDEEFDNGNESDCSVDSKNSSCNS